MDGKWSFFRNALKFVCQLESKWPGIVMRGDKLD